MAYTEKLKERVEVIFQRRNKKVVGKIFMGGYCFFIDDKMCVGLDIDKKTNKDRLLARIGEDVMQEALSKTGCKRMDIKGKPMKGFVFVDPSGFKLDSDLDYWIQLSILHNPSAKSHKKNKIN